MCRFHIVINNSIETEVEADASTSLLETMEATGLETRYHCRNGFCGACRTKLITGTVTYIAEPLAYVRPGDILPCICSASSDLTIEH